MRQFRNPSQSRPVPAIPHIFVFLVGHTPTFLEHCFATPTPAKEGGACLVVSGHRLSKAIDGLSGTLSESSVWEQVSRGANLGKEQSTFVFLHFISTLGREKQVTIGREGGGIKTPFYTWAVVGKVTLFLAATASPPSATTDMSQKRQGGVMSEGKDCH